MTFEKRIPLAFAASVLLILASTAPVQAADQSQTRHRTVEVDGLEIFYREAGSPEAPTLLLLHGFPTSSHMFRDLIPQLADQYHLVAPDYPGYGNSAMPARPVKGRETPGAAA